MTFEGSLPPPQESHPRRLVQSVEMIKYEARMHVIAERRVEWRHLVTMNRIARNNVLWKSVFSEWTKP